jgi:hypothetical protein
VFVCVWVVVVDVWMCVLVLERKGSVLVLEEREQPDVNV